MNRATVLFLVFFGQIWAAGCQSDGQKLHDFAVNFPREFFKNFPDSAALAGQKVPLGELLAAPDKAFFVEKKAFLEKKRAELRSIETEKLDAAQLRVHYFLEKKLENQLARFDGELSLFDARPVLQFFWENKTHVTADRRADVGLLLKKIPLFYAAAKGNFTKKKEKNGAQAVVEGIETFRFLTKLKKEFPGNGDLDAAVLAVKDWIAFCN